MKTEKLAGGVNSFLGFVKTGRYYTPNTVMAEDIRKNTGYTQKVLAILSKKIDEPEYNRILSVGKKIEIVPLLEKVSSSFKIDKSLLESTPTKQIEQNEKKTDSTKKISNTTVEDKQQNKISTVVESDDTVKQLEHCKKAIRAKAKWRYCQDCSCCR